MASKRRHASQTELFSEDSKHKKLQISQMVKEEEIEENDMEDDEEEADEDEDEEEVDEDEDEAEEEDEEEDAGDEESEEEHDDQDNESKREKIRNLLEAFNKDKLIDIVQEAARVDMRSVVDMLISIESDPVHRKVFVYGLGWEVTNEILRSSFEQYDNLDECNVVIDKASGRCKGYGFVLFHTRAGAKKALVQSQKKIGHRMATCQLAATGTLTMGETPDNGGRRLYVAKVRSHICPETLMERFSRYGEIEDGPLGIDKDTGKFKGYAIIVYKSADSCTRALKEPVKIFQGCKLQCSRAIEMGKSFNSTSMVSLPANPNIAANLMPPLYPFGVNPTLTAQLLSMSALLSNPATAISNQSLVAPTKTPFISAGFPQLSESISHKSPQSVEGSALGSLARNSNNYLYSGLAVHSSLPNINPTVIDKFGSQTDLQGFGGYHSYHLNQSSTSAASGIGF